jgi:hypothetical protein
VRLGPTGILNKEKWTPESANALAHFFQLVEVIGNSDWLKSTLSIGSPEVAGSPPWINSFECPDLAQTYSILPPIRQLYEEDDALNCACNVYLRHVNNARKQWWIKQTKKMFNRYLKSVPTPLSIDAYSVKDFLKLVAYGAGLIHYGKTEAQSKQNFKDVLSRHCQEWVIFIFLVYCRDLYGYANRIYFVLGQDYENWLSAEGCQPPDLVFLKQLFASSPLRTDKGPK